MDVDGPGVIRHIWLTYREQFNRDLVMRIYWDGQENPSVEVPLGDFFCNAWNSGRDNFRPKSMPAQNILAVPINVNPKGGMNCYFPMPFLKNARITITNDAPELARGFFYTINYTLEELPDTIGYFHAHWRRTNPVQYGEDYTLIDGIEGRGQFVGCFVAWQQNNAGWWGEGELKFFMDGDEEFPTICGTGTEDYFGGAWCFLDVDENGKEQAVDYSAPYLGFKQVANRSGDAGARMTMYRFHVLDPIFFETDLRVTMQALGWRSEYRYLPLQDDIASVVYWYQTLPSVPFAPFPERNVREVI